MFYSEPYLEAQVLHSTYVLIKHHQLAMDLVALELESGKRIYSFLSVAWGLTSDVDIESEKYRRVGNFRFTIGAIVRILGMSAQRSKNLPSYVIPKKMPSQLAILSGLNHSTTGVVLHV